MRPQGQGRHCGGTRNVGPNSVRPRPSAAGPYVLLLRPGKRGNDQRRRQNEESQRFAESHGHLARPAWTILPHILPPRRGGAEKRSTTETQRRRVVKSKGLFSASQCLCGLDRSPLGGSKLQSPGRALNLVSQATHGDREVAAMPNGRRSNPYTKRQEVSSNSDCLWDGRATSG